MLRGIGSAQANARGITSSRGVRTPKEANKLYYWSNKEKRVKREEKKRKETEGIRGAQMLRRNRG